MIDDHYKEWYDGLKYKTNIEAMKQYANSPFNDMACDSLKWEYHL